MLKKDKKGIVLCVILIGLIFKTGITLQSQLQFLFATNIDFIPDSDFDGIITSVIDGDTLDIRTNGGNLVTIRLALVDAPETNELGYNEAKDFISQNCLDKPATVDPDNNQDLSYGRLVALVYCDGININEAVMSKFT